MRFNKNLSSLQQKMAASSAGTHRRFEVFKALGIISGQTILDIGCGAGHLIEDLALAVGKKGRVIGIDPSEAQLESAHERCKSFNNVELLCVAADQTKLKNNLIDAATSTQTLEYIKDVDATIYEIARVLKSQSKFVNVSILWDHFKFHGPENKLNDLIHEAFKAHCFHQMLPMELDMRLRNAKFTNIKSNSLAFLVTNRHANSPAKFSEEILARSALKQGISEDKVLKWREQLATAEQEGRFGFTSFPVITEANLR